MAELPIAVSGPSEGTSWLGQPQEGVQLQESISPDYDPIYDTAVKFAQSHGFGLVEFVEDSVRTAPRKPSSRRPSSTNKKNLSRGSSSTVNASIHVEGFASPRAPSSSDLHNESHLGGGDRPTPVHTYRSYKTERRAQKCMSRPSLLRQSILKQEDLIKSAREDMENVKKALKNMSKITVPNVRSKSPKGKSFRKKMQSESSKAKTSINDSEQDQYAEEKEEVIIRDAPLDQFRELLSKKFEKINRETSCNCQKVSPHETRTGDGEKLSSPLSRNISPETAIVIERNSFTQDSKFNTNTSSKPTNASPGALLEGFSVNLDKKRKSDNIEKTQECHNFTRPNDNSYKQTKEGGGKKESPILITPNEEFYQTHITKSKSLGIEACACDTGYDEVTTHPRLSSKTSLQYKLHNSISATIFREKLQQFAPPGYISESEDTPKRLKPVKVEFVELKNHATPYAGDIGNSRTVCDSVNSRQLQSKRAKIGMSSSNRHNSAKTRCQPKPSAPTELKKHLAVRCLGRESDKTPSCPELAAANKQSKGHGSLRLPALSREQNGGHGGDSHESAGVCEQDMNIKQTSPARGDGSQYAKGNDANSESDSRAFICGTASDSVGKQSQSPPRLKPQAKRSPGRMNSPRHHTTTIDSSPPPLGLDDTNTSETRGSDSSISPIRLGLSGEVRITRSWADEVAMFEEENESYGNMEDNTFNTNNNSLPQLTLKRQELKNESFGNMEDYTFNTNNNSLPKLTPKGQELKNTQDSTNIQHISRSNSASLNGLSEKMRQNISLPKLTPNDISSHTANGPSFDTTRSLSLLDTGQKGGCTVHEQNTSQNKCLYSDGSRGMRASCDFNPKCLKQIAHAAVNDSEAFRFPPNFNRPHIVKELNKSYVISKVKREPDDIITEKVIEQSRLLPSKTEDSNIVPTNTLTLSRTEKILSTKSKLLDKYNEIAVPRRSSASPAFSTRRKSCLETRERVRIENTESSFMGSNGVYRRSWFRERGPNQHQPQTAYGSNSIPNQKTERQFNDNNNSSNEACSSKSLLDCTKPTFPEVSHLSEPKQNTYNYIPTVASINLSIQEKEFSRNLNRNASYGVPDSEDDLANENQEVVYVVDENAEIIAQTDNGHNLHRSGRVSNLYTSYDENNIRQQSPRPYQRHRQSNANSGTSKDKKIHLWSEADTTRWTPKISSFSNPKDLSASRGCRVCRSPAPLDERQHIVQSNTYEGNKSANTDVPSDGEQFSRNQKARTQFFSQPRVDMFYRGIPYAPTTENYWQTAMHQTQRLFPENNNPPAYTSCTSNEPSPEGGHGLNGFQHNTYYDNCDGNMDVDHTAIDRDQYSNFERGNYFETTSPGISFQPRQQATEMSHEDVNTRISNDLDIQRCLVSTCQQLGEKVDRTQRQMTDELQSVKGLLDKKLDSLKRLVENKFNRTESDGINQSEQFGKSTVQTGQRAYENINKDLATIWSKAIPKEEATCPAKERKPLPASFFCTRNEDQTRCDHSKTTTAQSTETVPQALLPQTSGSSPPRPCVSTVPGSSATMEPLFLVQDRKCSNRKDFDITNLKQAQRLNRVNEAKKGYLEQNSKNKTLPRVKQRILSKTSGRMGLNKKQNTKVRTRVKSKQKNVYRRSKRNPPTCAPKRHSILPNTEIEHNHSRACRRRRCAHGGICNSSLPRVSKSIASSKVSNKKQVKRNVNRRSTSRSTKKRTMKRPVTLNKSKDAAKQVTVKKRKIVKMNRLKNSRSICRKTSQTSKQRTKRKPLSKKNSSNIRTNFKSASSKRSTRGPYSRTNSNKTSSKRTQSDQNSRKKLKKCGTSRRTYSKKTLSKRSTSRRKSRRRTSEVDAFVLSIYANNNAKRNAKALMASTLVEKDIKISLRDLISPKYEITLHGYRQLFWSLKNKYDICRRELNAIISRVGAIDGKSMYSQPINSEYSELGTHSSWMHKDGNVVCNNDKPTNLRWGHLRVTKHSPSKAQTLQPITPLFSNTTSQVVSSPQHCALSQSHTRSKGQTINDKYGSNYSPFQDLIKSRKVNDDSKLNQSCVLQSRVVDSLINTRRRLNKKIQKSTGRPEWPGRIQYTHHSQRDALRFHPPDECAHGATENSHCCPVAYDNDDRRLLPQVSTESSPVIGRQSKTVRFPVGSVGTCSPSSRPSVYDNSNYQPIFIMPRSLVNTLINSPSAGELRNPSEQTVTCGRKDSNKLSCRESNFVNIDSKRDFTRLRQLSSSRDAEKGCVTCISQHTEAFNVQKHSVVKECIKIPEPSTCMQSDGIYLTKASPLSVSGNNEANYQNANTPVVRNQSKSISELPKMPDDCINISNLETASCYKQNAKMLNKSKSAPESTQCVLTLDANVHSCTSQTGGTETVSEDSDNAFTHFKYSPETSAKTPSCLSTQRGSKCSETDPFIISKGDQLIQTTHKMENAPSKPYFDALRRNTSITSKTKLTKKSEISEPFVKTAGHSSFARSCERLNDTQNTAPSIRDTESSNKVFDNRPLWSKHEDDKKGNSPIKTVRTAAPFQKTSLILNKTNGIDVNYATADISVNNNLNSHLCVGGNMSSITEKKGANHTDANTTCSFLLGEINQDPTEFTRCDHNRTHSLITGNVTVEMKGCSKSGLAKEIESKRNVHVIDGGSKAHLNCSVNTPGISPACISIGDHWPVYDVNGNTSASNPSRPGPSGIQNVHPSTGEISRDGNDSSHIDAKPVLTQKPRVMCATDTEQLPFSYQPSTSQNCPAMLFSNTTKSVWPCPSVLPKDESKPGLICSDIPKDTNVNEADGISTKWRQHENLSPLLSESISGRTNMSSFMLQRTQQENKNIPGVNVLGLGSVTFSQMSAFHGARCEIVGTIGEEIQTAMDTTEYSPKTYGLDEKMETNNNNAIFSDKTSTTYECRRKDKCNLSCPKMIKRFSVCNYSQTRHQFMTRSSTITLDRGLTRAKHNVSSRSLYSATSRKRSNTGTPPRAFLPPNKKLRTHARRLNIQNQQRRRETGIFQRLGWQYRREARLERKLNTVQQSSTAPPSNQNETQTSVTSLVAGDTCEADDELST